MTGRWQDIQRIFAEAASRQEAERAQYLDEACSGDAALRAEVESLLGHHAGAPSGFLGEDATADAATLPMEEPTDDAAGDPNLGRRIGRYRITERIASGGMGTVYLAVQEQPRRTVALKLMKRGITSRSALRRFEFEAQLLARLRHPGIAQVYEAGTHDDGEGGVPFFAMEYVPGATTLTEYAERKKLATRERLELFAKVCDAVGHGHQKGIIHRDLKPGNVLVDGTGQPKIIDFGVARATDSDMAVTTLQTHLRQLIGTLQYMSPEQCRGDAIDLDVRSDVYSLGVVLYELLCGTRPYDISDAPMPAAITIICEQEPARPSTLDRTLRGDIETIALKAMEKDRERRYRNADDFGDDVRRHLKDEPIEARPPGLRDIIRRFARKHKATAAGIAGAFGVLVVAVLVVSGLLVRANVMAGRAADTARQLWENELDMAPEWVDETAMTLVEDARGMARSAERSNPGSAAKALVDAVSLIRQAKRLQNRAEIDIKMVPVEKGEFLMGTRPEYSFEPIVASGSVRSDPRSSYPLDPLRRLEAKNEYNSRARRERLGLDSLLPEQPGMPSSLRRKLLGLPSPSPSWPGQGSARWPETEHRRVDLTSPTEQPQHPVAIAPYLLSATEVTQHDFVLVMGFNPSAYVDDPQRPVDSVNWIDALRFCNRLSVIEGRTKRYVQISGGRWHLQEGTGYRLPTEAEWEYACRAGRDTELGDQEADGHMWYSGNSNGLTSAVALKSPNAFGLYDMQGNVWEWCEDSWQPDYTNAPETQFARRSEDTDKRVVRGGSFSDDFTDCRSASRRGEGLNRRGSSIGFRVALDVGHHDGK